MTPSSSTRQLWSSAKLTARFIRLTAMRSEGAEKDASTSWSWLLENSGRISAISPTKISAQPVPNSSPLRKRRNLMKDRSFL